MSLRREQLERQLQNAEAAISDYAKVLDEQNIPAEARKKHPKWRQINAQKTQVKNRLKSLKKIEDREAAIKAGASAETVDE